MSPQRILILDDEETLADGIARHLGRREFVPVTAYGVKEAIEAIERSRREGMPFDAVLTDLVLPDGDGREIVRFAREKLPHAPVLMMTGSGSVSRTVDAIRVGAVTVLEKPVPLENLEAELRGALRQRSAAEEGIAAASAAGIVGRSLAMRALVEALMLAAPTDAAVLIHGETGTGKELVAAAVHKLSRRAEGPFVAVNCAALPETLAEAELFGHAKGAFTGADRSRRGHFRNADGGTLFLDEIGDMPLALQAKLLRALQESEVLPLGAEKAERVDVRIVAATNRNLEERVSEGTFRGDLYYRLNVVPLAVPPLRARPEDVALLAEHFLSGAGRKLTGAALAALERYDWPGNVREMENLLHRTVVLKPAGDIGEDDLPPEIRGAAPRAAIPTTLPPSGIDLYAVLRDLEDRLIREALERSGGNKSHAAQQLGLNRTTLVEKLRRMRR
jgi:DNA-binding NtrC family response regulator